MYRIELTRNTQAKKPKGVKIGLIKKSTCTYQSLIKFAADKLVMNPKKIRIFVCRNSPKVPLGTEILSTTDLSQVLSDGILLAVSKGEDYVGRNDQVFAALGSKSNANLLKKIPHPPRWPFPGKLGIVEERQSSQTSQSSIKVDTTSSMSHASSLTSKQETDNHVEIKHPFPILKGNVLKLVRQAVQLVPAITETETADGYIVFDYRDNTEFPDLSDSWKSYVIRECRGLILDPQTGRVLARRFHKFFNVNEKPETQADKIDWSGMTVLEKLDGVLVSPVLVANNNDNNDKNLIWVTRKCRSSAVEEFVAQHDASIPYRQLAKDLLSQGRTPLFEWCSPEYVVGVIAHQQPSLTLLAIRDNETGEYNTLSDIYPDLDQSIPVVKEYTQFDDDDQSSDWTSSFVELQKHVDHWTDREGVVICLPDGSRYKYKCPWYVSIARAAKSGGGKNFLPEYLKLQATKTTPTLRQAPGDQIWLTALTNSDDVIARVVTLVSDTDEGTEFLKFVAAVQSGIQTLIHDLQIWIKQATKVAPDQQLLTQYLSSIGWPAWMVPDLIQERSIESKLVKFLCQIAKRHQIEALTNLLDVHWNRSYARLETDDQVLDEQLAQFDKCPKSIQQHVIDNYLPKKLSQLIGISPDDLTTDTVIRLPSSYAADEGKFKGYWEMFIKQDIWDLRIDLQPGHPGSYTSHNGNRQWALLLVQYGLKDNPDTHPHGSFAGLLLPTDYDITVKHLTEAMALSFKTSRMIKLRRRSEMKSNHNTTNTTNTANTNTNTTNTNNTNTVSSYSYRIFCDLDEVLVDFTRGVTDATGRSPNEQPVNKMWNRLLSKQGFFQSLSPMPDGLKLWKGLLQMTHQLNGSHNNSNIPTILSGVPNACKKQVHREKRNWCLQHLKTLDNQDFKPSELQVITCKTSDKPTYSGPGQILIDDRLDTGKTWQMWGGHFIHHVNVERTLYELARLLGQIIPVKLEFPSALTAELERYQCYREVQFLVDRWPAELEQSSTQPKYVGIDAEWDQDNFLALVQIATSSHVYLLDMVDGSAYLKKHLHQLLINPEITKVGFGVDGGDITRLASNIINLIDLQELVTDQIAAKWGGTTPSLGQLTRLILDQDLQKSKEFIGKWGERPLTEAYCRYAANDAAVLLDILDSLKSTAATAAVIQLPKKNIYYADGSKFIQKRPDDFDPTVPVKVLYSAAFITEQSKNDLATTDQYDVPGRDPLIILQNNPTERELRGLPVGQHLEFVTTHQTPDRKFTRVTCKSDISHAATDMIIISSDNRHEYGHDDRNHQWIPCEEPLTVIGVIGLQVKTVNDPLAMLSNKVKARIKDFQTNAMTGQTLKFRPGELSAQERSLVHEYAKHNYMTSESSGKPAKRKLTLTMGRKPDVLQTSDGDSSSGDDNSEDHIYLHGNVKIHSKKAQEKSRNTLSKSTKRRITDAYQFSILTIATPNTHLQMAGSIESDQIVWNHYTTTTDVQSDQPIIYILRGLPGAGKSCLVKHLINDDRPHESQTCSADDYFRHKNTYQFSKEKLPEAHGQCFEKAKQAMIDQIAVIVIDNTNSRLSEYQKYLKLADEYNYQPIVLEIYCQDKTQAIQFLQRSTHHIPPKDILKILARWETDDNACLLQAYFPPQQDTSTISDMCDADEVQTEHQYRPTTEVSLQKWLSDRKLFHFQKSRRATHICMGLGTRPWMFVDIPDKWNDDFLAQYASSGIKDCETTSAPKYLFEVISGKFCMFFDIDYQSDQAITPEQILALAQVFQEVIPGPVYVSGRAPEKINSQIKTGVHFLHPTTVVNQEQAKSLRLLVLEQLEKIFPEQNWPGFLDDGVYADSCGLRMLGSRKVKKGQDAGRLYKFLFAVDGDGNQVSNPEWAEDDVELLKHLSIHVINH